MTKISFPTAPAHLALVTAALLAVSLFLTPLAHAKEPDLGNKEVEIQSYGLSIDEVLQDLFETVGRPVQISASVRSGPISAVFNSSANIVLRDLLNSSNLVAYDDGNIVFIHPMSEVQETIVSDNSKVSELVSERVKKLRLSDRNNMVNIMPGGQLSARGVPRYIQQISGIVDSIEIDVAAGNISDDRVLKVFHLKHAYADDMRVQMSGNEVVIPGVASRVRSMVGAIEGVTFSESDRPAALIDDVDVPSGTYVGPRVEPYPELNAVLVFDRPNRLPMYRDLIEDLDVEREQIQIEITFIDINTERARDLGVSFRASDLLGEDSVLFGTGGASDSTLFPGGAITERARGLAANFVVGNDDFLAARITALETEGIANVVNRAELMTLDNVEALLSDTETFTQPVTGERVVGVEKVTAGTLMRVLPTIQTLGNEHLIQTMISVEDGNLVDVGTAIPVVRNSSLTTQATVRPGETLVIGGFIQEGESESVDKVPLLGDAPLIGGLFSTTRRVRTNKQRIFLITPRLLSRNTPTTLPPILNQPQFSGAYSYRPLQSSPGFYEGKFTTTERPAPRMQGTTAPMAAGINASSGPTQEVVRRITRTYVETPPEGGTVVIDTKVASSSSD